MLLLAASLFFYSFYHWPSVFLLLFTIGFNYAMGRWQQRSRLRATLLLAVAANLSVLLWFKYSAFVAANINGALSLLGVTLAVPVPPVFLPLGDFTVNLHGKSEQFGFIVVSVTIEVDGALGSFAKPVNGSLDLVSQSFTLSAGTGINKKFDFDPKTYAEMFTKRLIEKGYKVVDAGRFPQIGRAHV